MLKAAPLSIAILGQLQLAAGQRDFSLTPPPNGFKCIKYPDSFRANVVHLSNEGYNAFLQAHTNMDQIRLSTGIYIVACQTHSALFETGPALVPL